MLDKDLWKRFLENKCTSKEADFVTSYLKEHPDELEQLLPESEWGAPDYPQRDRRLPRARRAILASRHWFYKAAIAIICIGLLLFLVQQNTQHPNKTTNLVEQIPPSTRWEIKTNTGTSPLRLTLEDGSDILLAQNSRIAYPFDFKGNRHIRLSGEARFNVAKDRDHPFRVSAQDVETNVLGTTFEISAYPESKRVAVKLISGKISVRTKADKRARILLPGQLYTLTPTGNSMSTFTKPKTEKAFEPTINKAAFTRRGDSLLFNKQALSYVFTVLGKEFETVIDFDKKAVHKKFFTGHVIKNRSLEKELKTIVLMNQLRLEKDSVNHRIIIK